MLRRNGARVPDGSFEQAGIGVEDMQIVWDPAIAGALERQAQAGYQAVGVARRAFRRSWGELPGRERAKYLFRIARILQERSREFAVLESLDGGKPIKESRDVDVPLAAAHFWYYAGWADKLEYAFPGRDPRPLGVAAQVIPWNFPLLMLAWKIAPALAAGNTVVLKPASSTPLSALLFADVCRQADLPAGVVNIITGPGEIGLALVKHPDVDKVREAVEIARGLAPDLVLLDSSQARAAEALAALDIPTLALGMHQVADLRRGLVAVGEAIGRRTEANALVKEMDAAITRHASLAKHRGVHPRVLLLIDRSPEGLRNLVAAGPKTYLDELLTIVGGVNMMAGSPVRYPQLSAEQILRGAPDIRKSSRSRHQPAGHSPS